MKNNKIKDYNYIYFNTIEKIKWVCIILDEKPKKNEKKVFNLIFFNCHQINKVGLYYLWWLIEKSPRPKSSFKSHEKWVIVKIHMRSHSSVDLRWLSSEDF